MKQEKYKNPIVINNITTNNNSSAKESHREIIDKLDKEIRNKLNSNRKMHNKENIVIN